MLHLSEGVSGVFCEGVFCNGVHDVFCGGVYGVFCGGVYGVFCGGVFSVFCGGGGLKMDLLEVGFVGGRLMASPLFVFLFFNEDACFMDCS